MQAIRSTEENFRAFIFHVETQWKISEKIDDFIFKELSVDNSGSNVMTANSLEFVSF